MTIQHKLLADMMLDVLVCLEPEQLEELKGAAESLSEAWKDSEMDTTAQHLQRHLVVYVAVVMAANGILRSV